MCIKRGPILIQHMDPGDATDTELEPWEEHEIFYFLEDEGLLVPAHFDHTY